MGASDPQHAPAGPVLGTGRLRLRRWEARDLEPFAAVNRDPRVVRTLGGPLDRAQSDALVARIEDGFDRHGWGLWCVERRDEPGCIGFVGLAVPGFEATFTPCVEIGWRLAAETWGHGYATEAAREVLRFAFEDAGLEEVVSFTAESNDRSRAVMARLGMRHDPADDFDHPNLPADHPLRRHVLTRLSRVAWLSSRGG